MREVPPEGESGEIRPDGVSGIQDRPPPFDVDAEGSVLGACFFAEDRPECLDAAVRMLRPADFYSDRHGRIFEAILELAANREPINIVSVGTLLKNKGRIAQVGGMGYLTEIINFVPAVNERFVVQAATIVRDKARRRRAIALVQRFQAEAYLEAEVGNEELFARFEKEFAGIREESRPTEASLAATMRESMRRLERRQNGEEMPVPLPWPSLREHFGGGFWPGVHFINSTTGIGKTAWALQVALGAARKGVPVAYIALELEPLQLDTRLMGDTSGVPWSRAYTGQVSEDDLARMRAAIEELESLPFRAIFGEPQGWAASRLKEVGERLRRDYPETNGPGSRPLLLILDFLQIVGDEEDATRSQEAKERIGKASYIARYLAARLNLAVLVISSVSREKAKLLSKEAEKCLSYKPDDDGRPIRREMFASEELIGTGKESGDIEYSGDSVSVIFRIKIEGGTDEFDTNTIFATVKGRATGPRWSPMVFTKFRYIEPFDGGASWVAAQEDAKNKKEAKKTETEARRETAKATKEAVKETFRLAREQRAMDQANKKIADIKRAIAYIEGEVAKGDAPSASRLKTLMKWSGTRWKEVKTVLGSALIQSSSSDTGELRIDRSKLPSELLDV